MKEIQTQNLSKRYYSISEVAKMFDVSKSLIRFWEQEFDVLQPHKTRGGERKFTKDNILLFQKIYSLVKERGFTLNGAKKELNVMVKKEKKKVELIKSLKNIRGYFEELKGSLQADNQ